MRIDPRRLRWVPLVLAILAEGAWISVAADFVEEVALRQPVLGVPAFAAAVLLGVILARAVGPRLGDRWPYLALAVAVVTSALGVVAATLLDTGSLPDSSAGLLAGALAAHPGGALLGVAVLRGYGHARLPLSEDRLGRLLVGGIVTLSFLALLGSPITEPYRSHFLADALAGSLVFAASVIPALALTRLTVIGGESGADWPANPAWLALLAASIAAVEIAAAPAAGLIGSAFIAAFWIAVGPLLLVGLVLGWTRTTARAAIFVLALGTIVLVVLPLIAAVTGGPTLLPTAPGAGSSTTGVNQGVAMAGGALLAVVATILLLLLIRSWTRGARIHADDVLDSRTIDRTGVDLGLPRWRPRFFHAPPADAASAYRSLVEDLHGRRTVGREPGETPREHASRLRAEGWGRLSLELLASDYALSRFAEAPLSPAEHRRAIRRWRRLRGDLQPAPIVAPPVRRPRPGSPARVEPQDDDEPEETERAAR